ncbi:MAG TPA: NAD-dependent epimerase/dehydratase family protein [Bacteroidales bacterium]|nr:NAD-dependent epimerase/dehydratase family protein [Bacteroidales bacterium]
MKILVTGANGFLASNVIRELNKRGHQVRALVRATADLSALNGADYELFRGNMVNMIDAEDAVTGCDVVIHAAADTSQHYRSFEPLMQTNYQATLNLLEASGKHHIKRFIFISTANTLGHGTRKNPGNETNPVKYPFSHAPYAISKMKAQELVQDYGLTAKLNTVVVNPTFMIGPYDTKPSSGRILLMMYGRRFVFIPPGGKNFIHVGDASIAICNAIQNGKSGSCYLLANENLTYSEFFEKLKKTTGQKSLKILLPGWFLSLLGDIGNLISYAGIRSDLNSINAEILRTGNYYTGLKAVHELNMPQTPVETAIKDAMQWFRENGYLKP